MWLPEIRPWRNVFGTARKHRVGLLLLIVGLFWACDLDYPTTTWNDPGYDHAELSGGFELSGPHQGAACTNCHTAGNLELKFSPDSSQDCLACHSAQFQTQHAGLGYPTTCLTCHNGQVWERAPFNHENASGGFELFSVHAELACTKCHVPETFEPRFTPEDNQDCVACHASQFEAQHAGSGYPDSCLICHNGQVWERDPFDHEVASGGFDLWGIHANLACTKCHVPETFQPRFSPENSEDCQACHA